ncbi:universal stress protein [Halobacteriales archaeon QS_1_68_17]|nr:MAG: universal stress protein [Halobacteriales archaeon QS_1_68_17]
MAPSHVLVPLDGSPLSDDALAHALATFECRVTVLNVVTPLDDSMSEGGVLEPGESRRAEARERASAVIDRAKRRAAEADREVETAVASGDPAVGPERGVAAQREADADHRARRGERGRDRVAGVDAEGHERGGGQQSRGRRPAT